MARRKIEEYTNGNLTAKVYHDSEWEEYRVTLWQDGVRIIGADYHTGDDSDATETAKAMAGIPQDTESEK